MSLNMAVLFCSTFDLINITLVQKWVLEDMWLASYWGSWWLLNGMTDEQWFHMSMEFYHFYAKQCNAQLIRMQEKNVL